MIDLNDADDLRRAINRIEKLATTFRSLDLSLIQPHKARQAVRDADGVLGDVLETLIMKRDGVG
jgi:hypothetical protein